MAQHMDVTVKGYLGADPILHIAKSGTAMGRMRLAHSTTRRLGSEFSTETQWFDVKCFGDLARNATQSLRKGSPVLVRGRIVTEHWRTKEGEERSKVAIIASAIGIELTRGIATYTKAVHNSEAASATEHHRDSSTGQRPGPATKQDASHGPTWAAKDHAGAGAGAPWNGTGDGPNPDEPPLAEAPPDPFEVAHAQAERGCEGEDGGIGEETAPEGEGP
ncbi:MAG: single-stranded DNA-binding protein [Bowdeniella nasicola]|nr:single-stranded DNA-binding protein [Bowdeniella nasicola]